MIACLAAELLKLRKRPAVWVLGALLLVVLLGLGYLIGWFVLHHLPAGSQLPRGFDAEKARTVYYPQNLARTPLQSMTSIGGALALILGVLSYGSEYGWGTLKTVFTQRPGRLASHAGRLVALALTVLVFDLAMFALAAIVSVCLALLDGKPLEAPPALGLLEAIAATWLVFATWCGFGVVLSVLFRQSALAIGIGLVYMLVVEGLIFGILSQLGGELLKSVQRFFPGPNAGALAAAFGQAYATPGARPEVPLVGAAQAVAVLALYLALFCAVSAALLRARDVA